MSDLPSSSGSSSESGTESGWTPRTKRGVALGVVVLVVVGLALPKMGGSESSDGGGDDAPMRVDATALQSGTVTERIRTSGTLRADESVELTAETAGKVTDIRFDEGDPVDEGALLVRINDAELQAEKDRLEHRLSLATDRAQRQKELLDEGGVSQEEYDATVNEVEVLRAELDLVEARIGKTQIRAPFSGVVGLREVSTGAYVSPQTTIATLQRTDPIKLDFSVSAQYAARVQTGQSVTFRVRGLERTLEGTVYASNTQVSTDTRTLRLRARAPNPDGALRTGMFADVTVPLGQMTDAIVVPSFAVVPTLDGQRVFVAENGVAQPRNVTLGVRTDSTVQVTDGLSLRDTVITSGIQGLRTGLPIRIESLE
ncbi:efflux RND transporter periplasmic adaptor subunit [Salinibacter ruber]|uniref:efflux RND transporter periplasmic adaptor subunit n=1 Tax=Salinibacter ruber TaxID=146919 RepID=UPI00216972A0|nr:efflux RND transporter periplasmic adaptor subunit [Salinibacter ruber]MCS3702411.1 membrane fusion protein (multidrug efflux system) [Salinibacter ruber]